MEHTLTEDLSFTDVSDITDKSHLFDNTEFNGDIPKWDFSNSTNMSHMFSESLFNADISDWNVSNVTEQNKFKIFTNTNNSLIDPVDMPVDNDVDIFSDYVIIPPICMLCSVIACLAI